MTDLDVLREQVADILDPGLRDRLSRFLDGPLTITAWVDTGVRDHDGDVSFDPPGLRLSFKGAGGNFGCPAHVLPTVARAKAADFQKDLKTSQRSLGAVLSGLMTLVDGHRMAIASLEGLLTTLL